MPRNNTCKFCGKPFNSSAGLKNHQNLSQACRQQLEEKLSTLSYAQHRPNLTNQSSRLQELHKTLIAGIDKDFHFEWPRDLNEIDLRHTSEPPSDGEEDVVNPDLEDKGDASSETSRYIEPCPASLDAGAPISAKKQTNFKRMRDERLHRRNNEDEGDSNDEDQMFWPFADEEEWDLARWLIRSVGQSSTDKFLKLPIVSQVNYVKDSDAYHSSQIRKQVALSYHNN